MARKIKPGIQRLASDLFHARQKGVTVTSPKLDVTQARAVLGCLLDQQVRSGDQVIGWKLGLTSAIQRKQLGALEPFVAPVFTTSVMPLQYSRLCMPKVEVEFVCRLAHRPGAADLVAESWAVGIEVIDSHDASGVLVFPFVIADWGLHAASALGEACHTPTSGETVQVQVSMPNSQRSEAGLVPLVDELGHWVQRETNGWNRPARSGDLVWTGSLAQPIPLTMPGRIVAEIPGYGIAEMEIRP